MCEIKLLKCNKYFLLQYSLLYIGKYATVYVYCALYITYADNRRSVTKAPLFTLNEESPYARERVHKHAQSREQVEMAPVAV